MKKFKLDYNFNDPKAMSKSLRAINKYLKKAGKSKKDVTVKDMIIAVNPKLYNGFSRGDKCRVGRGISTMYNKNLIPELERGKKKGDTNTYHII